MTAAEYHMLAKLLYGSCLCCSSLFLILAIRFRLLYLVKDVTGHTAKKEVQRKRTGRRKGREPSMLGEHPTENLVRRKNRCHMEQDIVLVHVTAGQAIFETNGKVGFMD